MKGKRQTVFVCFVLPGVERLFMPDHVRHPHFFEYVLEELPPIQAVAEFQSSCIYSLPIKKMP